MRYQDDCLRSDPPCPTVTLNISRALAAKRLVLTNGDSIRITKRLDLNLDAILLDAIGSSGYRDSNDHVRLNNHDVIRNNASEFR